MPEFKSFELKGSKAEVVFVEQPNKVYTIDMTLIFNKQSFLDACREAYKPDFADESDKFNKLKIHELVGRKI